MTKSKKIIVGGLIAMLGIVGATTATSGVAWFTTTRTHTVNVSQIVAKAVDGNLAVTWVTDSGDNVMNASLASSENGTTTITPAAITDVSGGPTANAPTFYKQYVVGNTATYETAQTEKNAYNTSLGNYVKFQLSVQNSGTNVAAIDVGISKITDTALFRNVESDVAADYYRLAIYDGNTCVFCYQNPALANAVTNQETHEVTTPATNVYLNNTTGATTTLTASDIVTSAGFVVVDAAEDLGASPAANNQMLKSNLASGNSVVLTFYIWCEGTMSVNAGESDRVLTSFQLVAVPHAAAVNP